MNDPVLINGLFSRLRAENRIGLMFHLVAGFPSIKTTKLAAQIIAEEGGDIIELQFPFSDPIADGEDIMKASEQALRHTDTRESFRIVKYITEELRFPVVIMCYFNQVFAYGIERFCADAAASGAIGLVVPDLPPEAEKREGLTKVASSFGIANIRVFAPSTTSERLRFAKDLCSGFVYCISNQGITGGTGCLPKGLPAYLRRVRKIIELPLAVGFSITSPEQIEELKPHADMAIIGSALVRVIDTSTSKNREKNIGAFVRSFSRVAARST